MGDDVRRRNLDRLIEQLESGDRGGDEADREALLDFSNRLELHGSEYSVHRHEKLLRHCTIAAEEVGGLADALEDREAAEAIVRWIHREYDNPGTNKDYRIAIRMFGKRLAERNGDIDTDDNGDFLERPREAITSTRRIHTGRRDGLYRATDE